MPNSRENNFKKKIEIPQQNQDKRFLILYIAKKIASERRLKYPKLTHQANNMHHNSRENSFIKKIEIT